MFIWGDNVINVAVCEDEALFRDKLAGLIKEYFELLGAEYSLNVYKKGEELLKVNHDEYSILCLDVEIKDGMNGIELAKEIRKKNSTSQIIFITSHQEEAYKAFEVEAFRYLLKPVQKEVLFQTLDAMMQKIKKMQKQRIIFKSGQKFVQLHISEVIYIETVGRKLRVVTLKKDYLSDNKLREVEDQLNNEDFFRVHKSYIVHLAFVKEHDNNSIIMQNGDQVFISRLKLISFKKKFVAYLRKEKGGGNG